MRVSLMFVIHEKWYALSGLEQLLPIGELPVEPPECRHSDRIAKESKANAECDSFHQHIISDEYGAKAYREQDDRQTKAGGMLGKRGSWG